MTEIRTPLRLSGFVQHYLWGKLGAESLVARFADKAVLSMQDVPCAELWFGSHPTGPSTVEFDGKKWDLLKLIDRYPREILGDRGYSEFGPTLPFLFKILSVRTALSIQAHPDKKFAAVLHAKEPSHYPDENHKPEIAVALTDVYLLYGFREVKQIMKLIRNVRELLTLVGKDIRGESDEQILKNIYTRVMTASAEEIEYQSSNLFTRLAQHGPSSAEEEWILSLRSRFPTGDPGLFSFYILNFFKLSPGEAVFIQPNMPHAYLAGDLLECMANSDNVVRAGLTNKFKDVETLLHILDFHPSPASTLRTEQVRSGVTRFLSPAEEFQLELIDPAAGIFESDTQDAVELLFCLSGEAVLTHRTSHFPLSAGTSYLLPASLGEFALECQSGQVCRVSVPSAT